MRKLLLTQLFFLVSLNLLGQTFMTSFKHSFKGLSIENSGVANIKDIACPQIQLSQLSGTGRIDSNQLEIAEELFRIFQFSKTQGKPQLNQWDTLMQLRNEYLAKKMIPLMLFDYSVHEFSDSFWQGQGYTVDEDSQFLVKLGPWKTGDLIASNVYSFIPLINTFEQDYQYLVFDERFIITNRARDTAVRFGLDINGHNIPIVIGGISNVIGLNPGINDFRFYLDAPAKDIRFNFSNKFNPAPNARRKFVSAISFNYSNNTPDWKNLLNQSNIETFQMPAYGKSSDGKPFTFGANVTIHFGKNKFNNHAHTCIENPIVFIEGIDFGYKNNPTGCRDGKCGNMGYLDLLKGQQWNVDSKKWEPWRSIENAPSILSQYRDSGFDIVYIDFWDGADLIENNALVVYQCLKNISQRLCGNEIHVVGVSMGGLIGKRALTMLENDTQTICVKSFTSFDAPLLGANIAISLQATASYYSDLFGISRDMKERMLNRPASKQMLLMHHEQIDSPHPLRNQFMSDPTMQAFPTIPWNWGIVNGSNLGMPQQKTDGMYLAPGEMLLHVNAFEDLKNKLTKIGLATGKLGIFLAGKILPSTDAKLFSYQAQLKGSPKGKGVVAVFESNIAKDKVWLVDNKKTGLDHQCGSQNNSILAFANISKGTLGTIKTELISENTCFIPTWSAMGNAKGSLNWSGPLSYQVGDIPLMLKNTPFQDYYAQEQNQDHAFFDSGKNGNAAWLLHKIISTNNKDIKFIDSQCFYGNTRDRFLGNINIPKGHTLNINHWKNSVNSSNSIMDSIVIAKQINRVFYIGDCSEKMIRANTGSIINIGSGIDRRQSTILHVKNRSKIEIHSGSVLHLTGENAQLIIHKNAVLSFNDSSTLIVDDGCKIIIEEGGKLNLGKSVNLYLNGMNALLHLGGNIHLTNNADLTIQSQKGYSTGLLKLNNVGSGYGRCNFSGDGNSNFQIFGNDKAASTVLQIEGLIKNNVFDTINIIRSNVKFGNHSRWICKGIVSISDSKFSPTSWAKYNINGITLDSGKLTIERSTFENLYIGLQINEGSSGCRVVRTDFIRCTTGFQSAGANVKVSNCMFKENMVGAEIQGSQSADSFDNCYFFTHSNIGLYAETSDTNNVPLSINSCGFYRNNVATQSTNRNLAYSCSILGYNSTGIIINNAKLICGSGSGENIKSDSISAGYNTFAFQDGSSIKLNNGMLYLNGKNNFLRSIEKSSNNFEVKGSLTTEGNWDNGSLNNNLFSIGENFWQPSKWNYSIDSIQAKYIFLGYYDISGHFNEVDMKGKLAKSHFVKCYDPNGSVSSAMKLAGMDNEYQDFQIDNYSNQVGLMGGSFEWPKNAQVYTVDGKLIHTSLDVNQMTTARIGLAPGIYILQWTDSDNSRKSKKIMLLE